MSNIRPVESQDIQQLVDLHIRIDEDDTVSRTQVEAAYHDQFASMFLEHPWADSGVTSLVAESDGGRIVGFIGVVPRVMSFGGRKITMAVSTELAVDVDARSTLLGLQLLKRMLQGPQDLTVADYANTTTQRIWEALGGTTAHLYSLSWTRWLNPGRSVVRCLSARSGLGTLTPLISPLARVFDRATANIPRLPWALPPTDSSQPVPAAEELTVETYARLLSDMTRDHSLAPVIDTTSAKWLFERLDRMWATRPVYRVLLRDEQQTPLGWFIYSLELDGSAEVAQIVARRSHESDVVNHLLQHAGRSGASAITGRVQPELLYALSDCGCRLHTTQQFALVHSNDPALVRPFETGDAFLSLLEGEGCLYLPVDKHASNAPTAPPAVPPWRLRSAQPGSSSGIKSERSVCALQTQLQ